ncbi:peptide deformylase [soil metagenome]
MVLDIVVYGDPILRTKGRPVTEVTDNLRTLAANMIETMELARGVGLAAPQIGQPIQLAVIDVSHDPDCVSHFQVDGQDANLTDWMPLIFINPQIEGSPEREADTEGCLSFPELRADVRRPQSVRATLTLLDGPTVTIETDGLLARALQHETDHLNGILFIDRLPSAKKLALKRKIRQMQDEYGLRYTPEAETVE